MLKGNWDSRRSRSCPRKQGRKWLSWGANPSLPDPKAHLRLPCCRSILKIAYLAKAKGRQVLDFLNSISEADRLPLLCSIILEHVANSEGQVLLNHTPFCNYFKTSGQDVGNSVWFCEGVAATSRCLGLMSPLPPPLPPFRQTGTRRLQSPRELRAAFTTRLDPHSCSG